MNKKIILPFSEINILNSRNKQFEFLSSYFFEADFNTEIYFRINLKFQNIKKPKKYKQVEKDVFCNQTHLYLSDTKKNLCRITSLIGKKINISCDYDFDLYYLFNFILEPLLIINLEKSGIIFIHSSAVVKNDRSLLFSAWRNTGKTEKILKLSTQNGYSFMSDDYVVLYKNTAYSFPKKINLFSYNLDQHLMSKISAQKVFKLKTFMFIKSTLEKASYIIPSQALSKVLFRVSELAEVATNFKIGPQKLGMPFSESAKIEQLNIIQKSNYKFSKKIAPSEAAELLKNVIGYELNDFLKITDKYLFLSKKSSFDKNKFLSGYKKNLTRLLKNQKIVLRSVV